jgi:hypothetical protein
LWQNFPTVITVQEIAVVEIDADEIFGNGRKKETPLQGIRTHDRKFGLGGIHDDRSGMWNEN